MQCLYYHYIIFQATRSLAEISIHVGRHKQKKNCWVTTATKRIANLYIFVTVDLNNQSGFGCRYVIKIVLTFKNVHTHVYE